MSKVSSFFQKVLNVTILSPHGRYTYIDGHVAPPKGKIIKAAILSPHGNYIEGRGKLFMSGLAIS